MIEGQTLQKSKTLKNFPKSVDRKNTNKSLNNLILFRMY